MSGKKPSVIDNLIRVERATTNLWIRIRSHAAENGGEWPGADLADMVEEALREAGYDLDTPWEQMG